MVICGGDQFATGSEFTLGIKFRMRHKGDLEVIDVAQRSAATAFSDVRRNRNRSFAHLVRQTESFAIWKMFGDITP
jgi:hypothetical protein